MSDNPFKAPAGDKDYAQPQYRATAGRSYVQQVPIISILMIVQAVFLFGYSLLMVMYAFFFSNFQNFIPEGDRAEFQAEMEPVMGIMMVVIGCVAFGVGLMAFLLCLAAYYGFNYKNRVFGIVAMVIGLAASLTCYCAPTAIGLVIYGMIIYTNPAVVRAFELRKTMSKDEMLAQFPN